jgi:hypothetical protein
MTAPVAGSLLQASIATSSPNRRAYTAPIRPSTRARIRGDIFVQEIYDEKDVLGGYSGYTPS